MFTTGESLPLSQIVGDESGMVKVIVPLMATFVPTTRLLVNITFP